MDDMIIRLGDRLLLCAEILSNLAEKRGKMDVSTKVQQPPKQSQGDMWLLVMEDMERRRQFGIAKYGAPVQANNGRDALMDAYQEVLDLAVYLRQTIEERNNGTKPTLGKDSVPTGDKPLE